MIEASSQFRIVLQDASDIQIFSESEFESVMHVNYLKHLKFKTDWIQKSVKRRCQRADKRGEILPKYKWAGAYYGKELLSGYTHPALMLKWIDSDLGFGIFAEEAIPRSAYIGEYTGVVRRRNWFSDRDNAYCFDYPIGFKTPYIIDAREAANLVRFINHSDTPNLEPMIVYRDHIVHIVLFSLKPIAQGAQLTYDYGMQYWEKRPAPKLIL